MNATQPCLPSIKSLLVEMPHDHQRTSYFPARPYLNPDSLFTNFKTSSCPLDSLLSPGDQFSKHQVVDKESANVLPRLPSLASTIGSTVTHSGSSNIHSLLSPPESPDKEICFETQQSPLCTRQQHSEKNHHHEYNNYVKLPSTIHHPSPSTPSMIYQNSPYSTHPQQEEHGYSQNRDCDSYSNSHNILQPAFTSFEHRSTSSVATALTSRHEQVSPPTSGTNNPSTSSPNNNNNSNNNSSNNNSNNNSSNNNRYQCPYCAKRFSRPSSLRIHTYSHTGEKPFVCTEPGCGRKFSVQSNMRRHLRVHRLGRPVKKVRYDGEVEGVKMMNPGIHMRN